MPVEPILRVLDRIREAFMEKPGLCVTLAQAQRRWNMDELVAQQLFEVLVASRFLSQTPDGAFMRAT